jgi:ribosomal-protein-alanine N-acetyltransferase
VRTNFSPFPELFTARLILRKLKQKDARDILFLRSDPRIMKFLHKKGATSIDEARLFIKTVNDNVKNGESVLWGIALKDEPKKVIGTICLWHIRPEDQRAEIGYVLDPNHWRKGIMKEAVIKVVEYGFKKMRLHSIDAVITAGNDASAGILTSTGFKQEGYLKENIRYNGKFYDTVLYARFES